jgi:diaminohydroxyphosphoribosylaminopyrimidine deaminase / 5-amino-6-(5-phosphoribosylamino)uracil reductase
MTFSAADERFMRRALALAERGRGTTRPNPVVGAVIVRGGRIVAEGFHRRAGEAHAEVNALAALRGSARGATMYVTLEPCCHIGRTGPCTAALLAARLGRIVVGYRDPNPIVDGRGIAQLRRAGVRVDVGCLEDDCRAAIRAYAVWVREQRPLVTLKAAATLDGAIADGVRRRARRPVWITGSPARRAAHELRAAHDAVLVGSGTVRTDNPRLTVRLPGAAGRGARKRQGKGPLRVVLVGRRGLPRGAHVLDRAADSLVLRAGPGSAGVGRALASLARHGIQSLLVEGGATIHGAFIAAGLVDRVALFVAPRLLGAGVPIAAGSGLPMEHALRLGPLTARAVGEDLLITGDVLQAKHRG